MTAVHTPRGPSRRASSRAVLGRLIVTEARLLSREPFSIGIGVVLPSLLLLALAAIPVLREPSPDFGGLRFIDTWTPTALILGMGMLGIHHLTSVIASYRESGVLRRMSTTPVHPGVVLVAHMVVVLTAMLASAVLLLLVSRLILDIALPHDPLLFAVAFVVGSASLVALGTVAASLTPNARVAGAVSMGTHFLVMLIGGVFLPRVFLPDFLVRLGEVTPPGVQLLLNSWVETADPASLSPVVQLTVMAGIALAAAALAAKLFRWE